jgi:hypothetical protein
VKGRSGLHDKGSADDQRLVHHQDDEGFFDGLGCGRRREGTTKPPSDGHQSHDAESSPDHGQTAGYEMGQWLRMSAL